jgi:hypothetical protein
MQKVKPLSTSEKKRFAILEAGIRKNLPKAQRVMDAMDEMERIINAQ